MAGIIKSLNITDAILSGFTVHVFKKEMMYVGTCKCVLQMYISVCIIHVHVHIYTCMGTIFR